MLEILYNIFPMKERPNFFNISNLLKEKIGGIILIGGSPLLVSCFLTLLRKPEAKCCWGVAIPLEFLRFLLLMGFLEKSGVFKKRLEN